MADLAFVLLRQAVEPQPTQVITAARRYGFELMLHSPALDGGGLAFDLTDGAGMIVTLVGVPHPDAVEMPVGVTSPPPEEIAASSAHLIVGTVGLTGDERARDTVLAQLTAAVLDCVDAVGAQLGHGVTFHRAGIFAGAAKLAADQQEQLPVEVAVDVTAAQESASRMSFLTHGLVRYGREELFVTCEIEGKGALSFVYDLARWLLAQPSGYPPTGDTVGRTVRGAQDRSVAEATVMGCPGG